MRYKHLSAHLLPENDGVGVVVSFAAVRVRAAAEAASVDAMYARFCVFARVLSVQKQRERGVTKVTRRRVER
jgi:hypothetical protein